MRTENLADFAARCGVELLRFAYLLSGDRYRAEDLVQDVLLAMYRRFGDTRLPLDNPLGYARRALANTNVSWSRRAAGHELLTDRLPDGGVNPEDPADRDELWRALRQLPLRQRTVLVMRFYADAPDAEIAKALGCRRGTVRSLASRALATLRTEPAISEGGRS